MADPEKKEPSMEERLAQLEADLRSEREGRAQDRQRTESLEATLRAIGTERQPAQRTAASAGQGFAGAPPSAEDMAYLKSAYPDATDQQLAQWWQQQSALFARMAAPVVQQVFGALGSAADVLDLHNALLEVDDYKPNRKEIEEERQKYVREGRQVPTRAELTQLVKARKLPELVQAETQRRMKEEEDRRASAASATTETGSVTAARQNPAGGGKKPLAEMSPDERETALGSMSREDRTKALEAEIGDTPIP